MDEPDQSEEAGTSPAALTDQNPSGSSVRQQTAQVVPDMSKMPVIYVKADAIPEYASKHNVYEYIRLLGAHQAETLSKRVTHYICTYQYFKHNFETIEQALKPFPHVLVVSFDWLERSIAQKKWQFPERFLLKSEMEDRKEEKQERKEEREQAIEDTARPKQLSFAEELVANRKYLGVEGYRMSIGNDDRPLEAHFYRPGMVGQHMSLRVAESVAVPKYFGTYILNHATEEAFVLAAAPVEFHNAFRPFLETFEEETGVSWFNRDMLRGTSFTSGIKLYCP